jgi:hypothetical protein
LIPALPNPMIFSDAAAAIDVPENNMTLSG